jgi:hypothetical protein
MKMKQLSMAVVLAMFGASAAFAVTPGADSPTAEGSKGVEQHDKSAPAQSTTEGKKDGAASTGASSTAPSASTGSFTQGESKRCAGMTGAEKDQCDKEEATKTEGPAAQEAAKPPQDSTKQ